MGQSIVEKGPFNRFQKNRFKDIIDPHHFMGRSAFDIPWKHKHPPTNLIQDKETYRLELFVPGYKKDELHVTIEHGVVVVSGMKQDRLRDEDVQFIKEEFEVSGFERHFTLAPGHQDHHVEAFYEDGILRIIFYVKQDPVISQVKRIPVTDQSGL